MLSYILLTLAIYLAIILVSKAMRIGYIGAIIGGGVIAILGAGLWFLVVFAALGIPYFALYCWERLSPNSYHRFDRWWYARYCAKHPIRGTSAEEPAAIHSDILDSESFTNRYGDCPRNFRIDEI